MAEPVSGDAAEAPPVRPDESVPPSEPVGDALYAAIDEACARPIRSAWSEVDERLHETLVVPLTEGLARHQACVEEMGLNGPAPVAWLERSDALLEYRRSVRMDLIEPLLTTYNEAPPAASVADTLRRTLDEVESRCGGLSGSFEAMWPERALDSRSVDRARRLWGKSLARVFSSARKAGTTRTVDARAFALSHLTEAIAPAVDDGIVDAARAWAEWGRSVEVAFVHWGDAALPQLVKAEQLETAEEEASGPWEAVAQAGLQLQEDLRACIAAAPRNVGVDRLEAPTERLEADAPVVGSFLLRPVPPARGPILKRTDRVLEAHEAWDATIAARLTQYQAILSLLAGVTGVQRRVGARLRDGLLAGIPGLLAAAEQVAQVRNDVRSTTSAGGWSEARLETLAEEVRTAMTPALDAVPDADGVKRLLESGADSTVEAVYAIVRQTPTALRVHAEDAMLPRGARPVESRVLALQDLTRQSFDALRTDRIRASTLGFADAVTVVRNDLADFENVFSFAYDAARAEIEESGEGSQGRAGELLGEAIDNIAEGLRAEAGKLEDGLDAALRRLSAEVSGGSLALIERLAAGRMTARLLAASSRFAEARAWVNETWGPPVDQAARALVVRARMLRRLVQRGVRIGSAMVGAAPAGVASTRSVKALADTTALTDSLPLVYQRLFTFDPVSDRALLQGRGAELTEATALWRQWQDGEGVPLIVTGRQGSGITSFLNVVAGVVEEDVEGGVCRVTLDQRMADEACLAAHLAASLGLEATTTLDELSEQILIEGSKPPTAVMVDNLEHVYMRVPQGSDLIERFLTFMAETQPEIFWFGGITTSAWQLITASEPTAVSQVDALDLEPLAIADLKDAVMVRHRRSGLMVNFVQPPSRRNRLRRRLLRVRDDAAYAQLIENDFFEQLYRTSSGYLRLALYQWLSTADFQAGEGVTLPQPQRPDFSVLDSLSLTQNFTLKAFLEHRTLTLAEHDQVFRLPRHESYQIFESLGNRHLIAPVLSATNGSSGVGLRAGFNGAKRSEINEEHQYRIRPLLVGAVINHLRARNIVH